MFHTSRVSRIVRTNATTLAEARREACMKDRMTPDRRKLWLPLGVLAGALVLWASLLALGAYLEWGADQPQHDLRKPLIVLATMAAFLAVWGIALLVRARRPRQKEPSSDSGDEK